MGRTTRDSCANGQGGKCGRDGSYKALVSTNAILSEDCPTTRRFKADAFHSLPACERRGVPTQPTSLEPVGMDAHETHLPILFVTKGHSAAQNGPVHSSAAIMELQTHHEVEAQWKTMHAFKQASSPQFFMLGIITANIFAQQCCTRPI